MSVEKYLWVAITDGPFIPTYKVDDSIKLRKDSSDYETKKAPYDLNTYFFIKC